jgi:hypothetical protein
MRIFYGIFCLISLFLDLNMDDKKLILIINISRHGARTPTKEIPEAIKYFNKYLPGGLTYNGWRQLNLLGRYMRNKFILNKKQNAFHSSLFLEDENFSKSFLVLSSPISRTLESAIAFSQGFIPDYLYNVTSLNHVKQQKSHALPPIKGFKHPDYKKSFNILIPNITQDSLFNARKCKNIEKSAKEGKDVELLSQEEREYIFEDFKIIFPISLNNITIREFTNEIIKDLISAIQSINFNFELPGPFTIRKKTEEILNKFLLNYFFRRKLFSEEFSIYITSHLFDSILKIFKNKTTMSDGKINYFNFPTNLNYRDLKLVFYSGHDITLLSFMRNLIKEVTLSSMADNYTNQLNSNFLTPEYSSFIQIHLIQQNLEYYIQVFYIGINITNEIKISSIKFDPMLGIPFNEFISLIESKINHSYKDCEFSDTSYLGE